MTPRFLSLEGGEGSGKSTQARAIADTLRARGQRVVVTREPGGSAGAEAIRDLLMRGDVARWDARGETLLFAAARADHVTRTIRPALTAGDWVVTDRFVDSTRAYQGAGGGIADAEIMALHAFGSGGLLPDLTILLDIPPALGAARATARDGIAADRFARRPPGFHAAVGEAFRALAQAEPTRFVVIDATAGVDDVTAAILRALAPLLT